MTVPSTKSKITFQNAAIGGGSGTSVISKMEFFVAKALHGKSLHFCCRELDLRQTLPCNIDWRSLKYDFTITM